MSLQEFLNCPNYFQAYFKLITSHELHDRYLDTVKLFQISGVHTTEKAENQIMLTLNKMFSDGCFE